MSIYFNPYNDQGVFHSSLINNAEPVDNHHPMNEKCRVYPNLGRKLTSEDIGKRVIRTYPQKCESRYDWSFIPDSSTKEDAEKEASLLVSIENGIKIKHFYFLLEDDSHWLTLEEWLAITDKDAKELENKTLRDAQKLSEQKSNERGFIENFENDMKILWESIKNRRPKSSVNIFGSLAAHKSAPIDNHYPTCEQQRVFPNLGRKLTPEDIGKRVIRTYPFKFEEDGSYDWSLVPDNLTNEVAEKRATKLASLKDGVVLEDSYRFRDYDSHWLTLEEWVAIPDKNVKELENKVQREAQKLSDKKLPNFRFGKNSTDSLNKLFEKMNKKLPQKPSLISTISNKKDSELCIEWIQQKLKILPEKFTPADYSFYRPSPLCKPVSKPGKLNLEGTSPREILGFPPNFDDLEVIAKRYRKLALKFHPDKNNDSAAEKFKKIKKAYEAIKLEIEGDFFVCGDSEKFEEVYTRAEYYYELFRTSKNPNEPVAASVNRWKLFHRELLKMNLNECDEKVILFQFQRLQRKVESNLKFWELRSEIENIQFPKSCEVSEKTVDDLLNLLKKLKELVIEYNLNNKGPIDCTWTCETIESCFEKANLFVIDKYAALARCAAEICLKMDQTNRALEIREEANAFGVDMNFNILSGKKIAKDEFDSKRAMNHSLYKTNKEKKKAPQEEKKESQKPDAETKLGEVPSNDIELMDETSSENQVYSEIQELKKNIEKNQKFFQVSIDKVFSKLPLSIDEKTSQVFSKWYVPLKYGVCVYKQDTNDFGVRIKEMVIASDKGSLFHQMSNLKEILEKLGIKFKETDFPYPVRDYFLKLHTGEIRGQNLSNLDLPIQRSASGAFYFNKNGLTHTANPFFQATTGVANAHASLSLKEMKDFGSVYLKQHFEGGNVFTVTNHQKKTQILIGNDHKYSNYLFHRSEKKLFDFFKSEEILLKTKLSESLSNEKIYKVAEKMYAHGILKINGETGYMDFEKISNVFQRTAQEKIHTIKDEGKNHFYRKKAIEMGLLKPFSEKPWVESYRASVSNFLYQKYIVNKAQAVELNVGPEDIHFLPQVMYHLDTFLKPGPKRSMFVANFAMNCDIIKALLEEAKERGLTQEDQKLLNRYLTSSQRLHQELSPLLDTVGKKIEKAGLTLIPMPGVFFDEPLKNEKTYNFNVMNAISGWSEKTNRYFYITSGIKVGDKLGKIFMDLISEFLKNYQADIDVFFVGSPKEDPEDFSEPMNGWNTINFQAGIHCFTFETSTASHIDIPI